jgi:hypothetical protein
MRIVYKISRKILLQLASDSVLGCVKTTSNTNKRSEKPMKTIVTNPNPPTTLHCMCCGAPVHRHPDGSYLLARDHRDRVFKPVRLDCTNELVHGLPPYCFSAPRSQKPGVVRPLPQEIVLWLRIREPGDWALAKADGTVEVLGEAKQLKRPARKEAAAAAQTVSPWDNVYKCSGPSMEAVTTEKDDANCGAREKSELPPDESCQGCGLCPADMYVDVSVGMLCLRCDALQPCPNCGNFDEHGQHWKLFPRSGAIECSGCGAHWPEPPWRVLRALLGKYGRHPDELPPRRADVPNRPVSRPLGSAIREKLRKGLKEPDADAGRSAALQAIQEELRKALEELDQQ